MNWLFKHAPRDRVGRMAKPKLMGYEQVAARAGVSLLTLRNSYMVKARAHRRAGTPRPGDLPEPDVTAGASPAWFPETIEAWLARRPGQGKGGGYPTQHRNE